MLPQLSITTLALAVIIIGLAYVWQKRSKSQSQLPLPPGPPGVFFFGNALQLPKERPWLYFTELGKTYGPVTYLNVAGQHFIILNTLEAAKEILVKRGMRYSSRPRLVVGRDYISSGHRLVLMPSDSTQFKKHRGAFHKFVSPTAVREWAVYQDAESTVMVKELGSIGHVTSAQEEEYHSVLHTIKRYTSSVVTTVTYGFRTPTQTEKPYLDMQKIITEFVLASNPGENLVDAFPILDYLPDFLSPWRKKAVEQGNFNSKVYGDLFRGVIKKRHTDAMATRSFASKLQEENDGLSELEMAFLCGSAFEAGTDTTASALGTFVLAMCTHPRVYKKLQGIVDETCLAHSPNFEQFEALPYVLAVVKETLRWRTVTAGGLPHLSINKEDDTYMGYRIPAGATVFGNHWGISLDEKQYPDPDNFLPERWLPGGANEDNKLTDLMEGHVAFGFGRRTCPGAALAVRSLFLVISRMSYFLDIVPDPNHKYDTLAYTAGFNIEPKPFPVTIQVREFRKKLLEQELEEADHALKGEAKH
ncbi:hypothetical protein CBS101457_002926 [Exobasidium rhododendri]|nr:hypothetical protein CBS101457_002926 [Exobasidium rhododendri]